MKLSIHTATYNRAHTLPKVYESLCNQTCYDFDWFVTDNGSTDNTYELFNKWCSEEKRFQIHYHEISERGIPRALNYGVNHVSGDYFFILDSDDCLLPGAIEYILRGIDSIDKLDDYVAVGFLRLTDEGVPTNHGKWPIVVDDDYTDCMYYERSFFALNTEMCEAYKVEILKKYPFPVWKNELFAPESLAFNAMALDGYKTRWYCKKGIIRSNYLEDGMTKGKSNIVKENKMGFAMLSNQRMLYVKDFKNLFEEACQHIALSMVAGYPSYILKSNKPWITALALPYGLVLSIRRYFQFKR